MSMAMCGFSRVNSAISVRMTGPSPPVSPFQNFSVTGGPS
jgi:hypothetical protein